MSIIEDRIVQMRFDNSGFDSKVADSQRSIKSLEKTVDDADFAKAFSPLIDAMSGVSEGFSKMEIVALGVLTNLATEAAEAGLSVAKSLAFDGVTAGWGKFEEKTTSIQTIMAATGASMEEVEDHMKKLSWFTDETSYSLTDMTNNIGKFTSNGVDLETSVTAMMGISNLAAISGQNVAAAARVMYNSAQALSQGYVALIDWKSIENANMATQEFRQNLIDAAIAQKQIIDTGVLDEKTGKKIYKTVEGDIEFTINSIRDSLSKGKWLTNDVYLAALKQYGGFSEKVYELYTELNEKLDTEKLTTEIISDLKEFGKASDDVLKEQGYTTEESIKMFRELAEQMESTGQRAFLAAQETKTWSDALNAVKDAVSTAWSNVYEGIFGNYEEAKVFWSTIVEQFYDLFVVPVQDLVSLIGEWRELGGRDDLLVGFENLLDVIQNIVDLIKDAFHDIFPKATAEQVYEATKRFHEFTERLITFTEEDERLKNGLKGLFSVLAQIKNLFVGIFTKVINLPSVLKNLGNILLNIFEKVGNTLTAFGAFLDENKAFEKAFDKIRSILVEIGRIAKDFAGVGKSLFEKVFGKKKDISDSADEVDELGSRFQWAINIGNKFLSFLDKIKAKLETILPKNLVNKPVLNSLVNRIFEISAAVNGLKSIVFEKLLNIVPKVFDIFDEALNTLFSKIKGQNLGLLLNRLLSGIKDIAKAAAGFIGKIDFTKMLSVASKVLKTIFGTITSLFNKIDLAKILNTVASAINWVIKTIDRLLNKIDVQDVILTVVDAITFAVKQIGKVLTSVDIAGVIATIVNTAVAFIKILESVISKVDIAGAINLIISVLSTLANTAISVISKVDVADFISKLISLLSTLADHFLKILNLIDSYDILPHVVSAIAKAFDFLKTVLGDYRIFNLYSAALALIRNAFISLEDFLGNNDIASKISEIVGNLSNKIFVLAIKIQNFAEKYVPIFMEKIREVFSVIKSFAKEKGPIIFTTIGEGIKKAVEIIKIYAPIIMEKVNEIAAFLRAKIDWIKELFSALDKYDVFKRIFSAATATAEQAFKIISQMVSAFVSLFQQDDDKFSWINTFTTNIVNAMTKVKNFLVVLRAAFTYSNTFEKVFSGALVFFQGLGHAISEVASFIKAVFKSLAASSEGEDSIYSKVSKWTDGISGFLNGAGNAMNSLDLSELTAKVTEFISKMKTAFSNIGETANKVFDTIKTKIAGIGPFIASIASRISELRTKFSEKFDISPWEAVKSVFEKIGSVVSNVGGTIGHFITAIREGVNGRELGDDFSFIEKIASKVARAISQVVSAMATLLSEVATNFANLFKGQGGIDSLNGVLGSGLLAVIINFVNRLTKGINAVTSSASGLMKSVSNIPKVFTAIQGFLNGLTKSMKQNSLSLLLRSIASSLLELAIAALILSTIDDDKLTSSLMAITAMFIELTAAFKIVSGSSLDRGIKIGATMKQMATAILILSAALKVVSTIDPERMKSSVEGLTVILAELIGAFLIVSRYSGDQAGKAGKVMEKMGVALVIVAAALKIVSTIPSESMLPAVSAFTAVFAELIGAFLIISNFNGGKAKAAGLTMILMAAALAIAAAVFKSLKDLSWEQIGVASAAMGIAIAELVASLILLSNFSKHVAGASFAAILMGAAIAIVAAVFKSLGKMSWSEIGAAAAAMGVALYELVAAMLLLGLFSKQVALASVGALIMSAALAVIGAVFKSLGGMNWSEILTAAAAMGIALMEIVAALILLGTNALSSIGGSIALTIAAAAITALTISLAALSALGWDKLKGGLLALGAAMLGLGVGAAVLGPLIPAMLGLSAAMALLGVAALALGAGLMFITAAIAELLVLGPAAIAGFITGMTTIFTSIIEYLPTLLAAIINSLTAIVGPLLEFIKTLVIGVCQVLIECAPMIIEAVLTIIDSLLSSLAAHAPSIVASLLEILAGIFIGIGEFLAKHGQDIVDWIKKVTNKIGDILSGVGKWIHDHIWVPIHNGFLDFINGIVKFGSSAIVKIHDTLSGFVKAIRNGIIDIKVFLISSIRDGLQKIEDMINDLVTHLPKKAKEYFGFEEGVHFGVIDTLSETINNFEAERKLLDKEDSKFMSDLRKYASGDEKRFNGYLTTYAEEEEKAAAAIKARQDYVTYVKRNYNPVDWEEMGLTDEEIEGVKKTVDTTKKAEAETKEAINDAVANNEKLVESNETTTEAVSENNPFSALAKSASSSTGISKLATSGIGNLANGVDTSAIVNNMNVSDIAKSVGVTNGIDYGEGFNLGVSETADPEELLSQYNQNGNVEEMLAQQGYDVGAVYGDSLANGANEELAKEAESGDMLAPVQEAIDNVDYSKMKSSFDIVADEMAGRLAEDDISSPEITPILDLTNVRKGASRIRDTIGTDYTINVHLDIDESEIDNRISAMKGYSENSTPVATNNYNLTQNNYSPKALNLTEQYRQSKNLFAMLGAY